MADRYTHLGLTWRCLSMLRRIWWAQQEMDRQGLAQGAAEWPAWSGYFCMGSGCVEDKTDSHGECINCGEPVVRVHDAAALTSR